MERPFLQFYTRDWLDDLDLRACSEAARALLADLMCIAHEGKPYGHLSRGEGIPLTETYIVGRLNIKARKYRGCVEELLGAKRLFRNPHGVLFVPRMVKDEETRQKRAAGGTLGGNPNLRKKDNLRGNHDEDHEGYPQPHVRGRADSASGSAPEVFSGSENGENPLQRTTDATELDRQISNLQRIYSEGGKPFNRTDEIQGIQLFMSQTPAVRENICRYVCWAFENQWRTPDKTKRFHRVMEDHDGDSGAPIRALPAVRQKSQREENLDQATREFLEGR